MSILCLVNITDQVTTKELKNDVKVKLLIWYKGQSFQMIWHFQKDAVVKGLKVII